MNANSFINVIGSKEANLISRCSIARVIYWRYSFNFFQSEVEFEKLIAREFIKANGMEVLLNDLALGGRHGSLDGVDERDKLVRLPPHALSHQAWQPIGMSVDPAEREEYVSLRRLCLEILSEMSNYKVYRREMGKIHGGLSGLIDMAKTIIDSWFPQKLPKINGSNEACVHSNNDMFILDRILNLLANLAFDLNRSIMRRDRMGFDIIETEEKSRKILRGVQSLPSSPETNSFSHILKKNYSRKRAGAFEDDASQKSDGKRVKFDPAISTLPCYVINGLIYHLHRLMSQTRCLQLLRTSGRLLANCSLVINARLIYRMSLWDFTELLRKLVHIFSKCNSGGESEINSLKRFYDVDNHDENLVISSGLRASITAQTNLINANHKVYLWNRSFKDEDDWLLDNYGWFGNAAISMPAE